MARDGFDLELVREIIRLAEEADLAELSVESGSMKISVKRGAAAPQVPPARATREVEAPAPAVAAHDAAGTDHLKPISAPMVGTFYRASSPDAPPFIDEGDLVERGQTVCIIEAMKLFNEIQSEWRGRLVKVLVENGSPVEYGQPLFLVDPTVNGS